MFAGLNRIAYDVLLENPMAGYMSQVVFTRVLGASDEIEGAEVWKDSNQCWVCEKWKKTRIEYYPDYKSYMRQNITKLSELDEVVKTCLEDAHKDKMEEVRDVHSTNKEHKCKLESKKIVIQKVK